MMLRWQCVLCTVALALVAARVGRAMTWHADGPCLLPSGSGWDSVSVKDPSIVYYNGAWHVFHTMMDGNSWRMGYTTAPTIAGLKTAKHTQLTALQGGGYFCAPEVFFFTPHNKWYLVYQSGAGPTYSTNTDISNPNGWAAGKNMGWSESGALDFWVISDGTKVHFFYSIDQEQTGIKHRSTLVSNFPDKGWSSGSVAVGPGFEGSTTYHNKKDNKYYFLVEDISRYYKCWNADSLDGPWTLVADKFAAKENLQYNAEHWTDQVSHGELVRAGYNEFLELEDIMNHADFLIQGITSAQGNTDYGHLPYRLGIIRNYVCPGGGTDCTPTPGDNSTTPTAPPPPPPASSTAPSPPPPATTTVCATAAEGQQASLSCPAGKTITAITFASYGLPSGSCPSFTAGSCHASSSVAQVQSACVGKSSCSVAASNNVFGDPCSGRGKTLDIAATCA